ncbi:MAG: hypothetical protein D6730_05780 [Bacteroidetes bacterium]|nr:MAG: hypothetical protein D6730_05780 [Bacteroidota bacterium]
MAVLARRRGRFEWYVVLLLLIRCGVRWYVGSFVCIMGKINDYNQIKQQRIRLNCKINGLICKNKFIKMQLHFFHLAEDY